MWVILKKCLEMEKSVNEIAKELGIEECIFDEIFELHYSKVEKFEMFSAKGICINVEQLRENLECAGKRCAVYVGFINTFEEDIYKTEQIINSEKYDLVAQKKWMKVLQTHRDVYEMMGYLTLLQMDALTTNISLLQAQNDTERIVLCKHAYTIIYEARDHDLFSKVSAGMLKYHEDLVKREDTQAFWKDIKVILKAMMNIKEAKDIRNKIDAHKDDSFVTQIALYKKCDWAVSVVNLSVLVMLIDEIQSYMGIIHDNVSVLYDQYYAYMKERMKQCEEILKQIQEYQEPVSEITKETNI